MEIETVIAIAKTLSPYQSDIFPMASYYSYTYANGDITEVYKLSFRDKDFTSYSSWESALCSAGWKG